MGNGGSEDSHSRLISTAGILLDDKYFVEV
jgi:hypothetical protein